MYDYELIEKNLLTEYIGQTFVQFEKLQSIHTKAKNISESCPEGMLILTQKQDDIRLKYGKLWYCKDVNGLYISIILKNKKDLCAEVQQIANASVCDAVFMLDNSIDIKIVWPNDIYIQNKKICSTFSEKIDKKDNDSIVISIYINISPKDIEQGSEYIDKIKCISDVINDVNIEILISNILNRFEVYYEELVKEKSISKALNVIKNHNDFLGNPIGVKKINKKTVRTVRAIDMEKDGSLRVADKNNDEDILIVGQDSIEWWLNEQQVKNW